MENHTEKRQILIDSEMNAVVEYDKTFKFILSMDDLSEYNRGFVNWHKQPAIEISIVYEGAVNALVLEHEETVTAGNGFFIMPDYLHSIRPASGYQSAKYFTLIFYPEILYGVPGSFFDSAYYRPVRDCNSALFTFSGQDEWSRDIFPKLKWIADQCPDETPGFRLKTQRILQDVWILFAENLTGNAKPHSAPHDTGRILSLVAYLHEHYHEKFSLTALAESVSMSRNECCRYFKRMMNMTITKYLLEYRLSKAVELLKASDMSITEIAEQTGFGDVSYFIKMFRLKTGTTPKAFSNKLRQDRPEQQS